MGGGKVDRVLPLKPYGDGFIDSWGSDVMAARSKTDIAS